MSIDGTLCCGILGGAIGSLTPAGFIGGAAFGAAFALGGFTCGRIHEKIAGALGNDEEPSKVVRYMVAKGFLAVGGGIVLGIVAAKYALAAATVIGGATLLGVGCAALVATVALGALFGGQPGPDYTSL